MYIKFINFCKNKQIRWMVNVLRRRSLFIEEVIVKIKFYSLNESDLFKNNIKILGHDNLSMFKNLLKYRHESKKQVCNSFTYFRGQI